MSVLRVSRGSQERVPVRSALAGFIGICEVGGGLEILIFLRRKAPFSTRLRACGSFQRNTLPCSRERRMLLAITGSGPQALVAESSCAPA